MQAATVRSGMTAFGGWPNGCCNPLGDHRDGVLSELGLIENEIAGLGHGESSIVKLWT